MFEVRSDPKRKPIKVDDYEGAQALRMLAQILYAQEVHITPEIPDTFDVAKYLSHLEKHVRPLPNGGMYKSVDLVILGLNVANYEQMDYAELLKPYIEANAKMVEQYKAGNDKALNAVMGKFLKENKGHDAKAVMEALITILK